MVSWLMDRIKEYGPLECISSNGDIFFYSDLLKSIQGWLIFFKKNSIFPGMVVSLVGDFSIDSISAFLALAHNNNIIVPLTIKSYEQNPEFLEVSSVQVIIKIKGGTSVLFRKSTNQSDMLLGFLNLKAPGLVLFSSGSTGESKAILHNLSKLIDKHKSKRSKYKVLTFLLFDHIGGINTMIYALSNGCPMVICEDRGPENICRIVEMSEIEILPVSPTFLNMLMLSKCYLDFDLSSLKKISYGTEPMPERTLNFLMSNFPNVTLQQTYGLSETGIVNSKSFSNDSLWMKIGGQGVETKVIDNFLWIKTDSAMVGYLNNPSPFESDGWLNTGDLVECSGEYIRILGRESEIINIGGEKVFPAEVENLLLEIEPIRDAVVFGEANNLTGQIVVAKVSVDGSMESRDLKKKIRSKLRGSVKSFKIPQKIIVVDNILFNERYKKVRLQKNQEGI